MTSADEMAVSDNTMNALQQEVSAIVEHTANAERLVARLSAEPPVCSLRHVSDEQFCAMADELDASLAEIDAQNVEIDTLSAEIQSLRDELFAVREDMEVLRRERDDTRRENELLEASLRNQNLLAAKARDFAKTVLENNSLKISAQSCNVVNSMPCFTRTATFIDSRPKSLDNCDDCDSYSQMNGMRLTHSKEENSAPTHTNSSNSNNTSDNSDTYMTANSRSSMNGQNGQPKPDKKTGKKNNPFSAMVCESRSSESRLETRVNTPVEFNSDSLNTSASFSLDESDNIKLKLVKFCYNKPLAVQVAYVETPSNFWLHVNAHDVNNYIHAIQVKQEELMKAGNHGLSASDVRVGMFCAAIYSNDGYWYRAQVTAIDYENELESPANIKAVHVHYVDWGNSEQLPIEKIARLSSDLTKRKQAIRCQLQSVHSNRVWSAKVVNEFKNIMTTKQIEAVFQRPLNELGNSETHAVDLHIRLDSGETDNLVNHWVIDDMNDMFETPVANDMMNDISDINDSNDNRNEAQVKEFAKNIDTDTVAAVSDALNAVASHCPKGSVHSKSDQTLKSNAVNGNHDTPNPFQKSASIGNASNESNASNTSDTDAYKIPLPIIPSTECLLVVPSFIVSPSEFYVQINDLQAGIAQLDDLVEQLQIHYSNDSNRFHLTSVAQVSVNSFWACKFTQDQAYYRARVMNVIDDQVLISYVDYGNTELVSVTELMPLTRQFAAYPALCVKCSLASVSPLNAQNWSNEAIDRFSELTGYDRENILTAYVGHRPEQFTFDSRLEVFLWNNERSSDDEAMHDILINSKLVVEKLADTSNSEWVEEAERALRERTPPVEATKNIKKLAYEPTSAQRLPNGTPVRVLPELSSRIEEEDYSLDDEESVVFNGWDPRYEDAIDPRNRYKLDTDDPATATIGFNPKDKMTCRYYGTKRGCHRDDTCMFAHVDRNERFAVDDAEEEILQTIGELRLEVGANVIIKVTGIQSPFSFFGTLPFGPKSLDESQIKRILSGEQISGLIECRIQKIITDQLKTLYSSRKDLENLDISPGVGTLVVAKDEKTGKYFRGRVITVMNEDYVCVLFAIDWGFQMNVKRRFIFKMDKYFAEFPALAVRCSVAGVEPYDSVNRRNANWSGQAIQTFSDWTMDQLFCLRVHSEKFEDKITVELVSYVGDEVETISEKLIAHKFAQLAHNVLSDEEVYESD